MYDARFATPIPADEKHPNFSYHAMTTARTRYGVEDWVELDAIFNLTCTPDAYRLVQTQAINDQLREIREITFKGEKIHVVFAVKNQCIVTLLPVTFVAPNESQGAGADVLSLIKRIETLEEEVETLKKEMQGSISYRKQIQKFMSGMGELLKAWPGAVK